MKSEDDPITDDEWILRRVRADMYQTNGFPFLSPRAFEPRTGGREPDTDGISVYRASCLSHVADVLAEIPPDKLAAIGLVRVLVAHIQSLGLSLTPKKTNVPGHCVIPELDAKCQKEQRTRADQFAHQLAVFGSRPEAIALVPPSIQLGERQEAHPPC